MTSEVEWRRKWKPGLEAFPWQPIRINDVTYLLKYQFTTDSYGVLLTDFTKFWKEELSDKSLMKRIKELNPGIEAPLVRILDQIKSVLDKTQQDPHTSIKLSQKQDDVTLSLKSRLAGMPFVWNFHCKHAESNIATEHLTIPLMAMVSELNRRQQELVKIIESKDKQIEDYKSQGAKCSRKHFETPTFVETAFEMSMMTSKSFDNHMKDVELKTFNSKNQDMYRQIMSKRAFINRSPGKDKPDNDGLIDDSITTDYHPKSTSSSSSQSWGNSRLPPSLQPSPTKKTPSPSKSSDTTPDTSPVKDSELLRRQALERRLEMEENKKIEKTKKKKKIGF
ncbi:Non-ous end-joining factor 1 [Mactra antiquata]